MRLRLRLRLRGRVGVRKSIAVALLGALFAIMVLSLFRSKMIQVDHSLLGPSPMYPLGTDSLGRDYWARVGEALWTTGFVGVLSSVSTLAIALAFGFFTSQMPNWFRYALLRGCEIVSSIPNMIWVSLISASLSAAFSGRSEFVLLWLGISLGHWIHPARLFEGLISEELGRVYVLGARAVGAGRWRILRDHVFPNLREQIWTTWMALLPTCLLYEGVLSFLGFGVNPPRSSLGILMKEGWQSLSLYPHLLLVPSVTLFVFVWSLQALRLSSY